MSTLHFSRIRPLGLPQFIDPQADITTVTGRAIAAVLSDMEQAKQTICMSDQDKSKLIGLLEVFSIRLRQDPTALSQQIAEFVQAYKVIPQHVTAVFMQLFGYAVLLQYALFMRRDAKYDEKQTIKVLPSLMVLMNAFTTLDTPDKLKSFTDGCKAVAQDVLDVVNKQKSVLNQMRVDAFAPGQDGASDVTLQNIKATAFAAIGGSPTDSWQELSQKCAIKLETAGQAPSQCIPLALAYPSYKYPFLQATIEDTINVTNDE